MHDTQWAGIVRELARNPTSAARLRDDHSADAGGYCKTCRTPGRGTPLFKFPCSLRTLAEQALGRYPGCTKTSA